MSQGNSKSANTEPKQQHHGKNTRHKQVVPTEVKHSWLQMTAPYYQYSILYNSIFKGYYSLLFMYSIYFMLVYPFIKLINGGDFFKLAAVQITEANLIWDLISIAYFFFVSLIFLNIGNPAKRSSKLMIIVYVLLYLGVGYYVSDNIPMYFTDRIFIVFMSWNFFTKMVSYELDCKDDLQKKGFNFKLKFLVCPIIVYSQFAVQHDPKLKLNYFYLFKKGITAFGCIFITNILMVQFIDPLVETAGKMSFLAFFFKIIPYTFYMNVIVYYLVFENIISCLSQISQIKNRMFYTDWWNAETVHQYLLKWTVLMNNFSLRYFSKLKQKSMVTLHVGILLVMLLEIFARGINFDSIILFLGVLLAVYFLGEVKLIQNNYIVHLLTIAFTPLLIALHVKYGIFKQNNFWNN